MDHLEPDAITPIGPDDDGVYDVNNQRALLFGGMLLGCLIFALAISQLTNDSDEVSLSDSTVQPTQAATEPTNQVPTTAETTTTTTGSSTSSSSSSVITSLTTIQTTQEALAGPKTESDDTTTTTVEPATTTTEVEETTTTTVEPTTTTTTTRIVEEKTPVAQVSDKVVVEPLETLIDIIKEQTTTTTVKETTTTEEETTTTEKETTTTKEETTTTQKPAATQNPAPTDGKTVWVENFNSLDSSKWDVQNNSDYGISKEVQCYMGNNVRVSDGKLVLTARKGGSTCGNRPNYSSGMVRGKAFSFSPGQALEFRAKLTPASSTNQAGLFPAVWSSSWDGRWPLGGEFDYLEVMTANNPTKPFFSMHYQKPDGSKGISNKFVKLGENFTNEWHTVRVEYRTGDLRWFMDGKLGHTVDYANTAQGWPAPFDRTIRDLKINLALGGNPGPLDPRALGSSGAKFEIDYMKVSNL